MNQEPYRFHRFGIQYTRYGEVSYLGIFGFLVYERVGKKWRLCFQ